MIVWLTLIGLSAGYIESAVVVYLRELYYPENLKSIFPLKLFTPFDYKVELIREFFTLFILYAVASCFERRKFHRLSIFFYLWGAWDIFYYIWLKILIGWPTHILDWDVLFLIPLPWFAPWICPVLIALCFVIFSGFLLNKDKIEISLVSKITIPAGFALLLYSFLEISINLIRKGMDFANFVPHKFNWLIYILGLCCVIYGGIELCRRSR